MQTKRFQRVQDVIRRTEHTAWYIDIFDAHQPGAVLMFRIKVTADGGDQ
jgi:hypothetical protein